MQPGNRVALYARPAATAEPTGDQLRRLRHVAAEHGWLVVVECVDRSADPKGGRPEVQRLLAQVRRGAVDLVAVTRLSLLARSVGGLVELLDEAHARGVHVVALDDQMDSTQAISNPLDIVAMLRRAGRDYAREQGACAIASARRRGSAIGRPSVKIDVEAAIKLRRSGRSIRRIALTLGCSATSVHRALRAAEREAATRPEEPREAA